MTIRHRVAILVVGGLLAATVGWATAQTFGQGGRPLQPVQNPVVLSGNDVGFRVEAYDGTTPVGKLVVKVDGQWVETRFSGPGFKRVTTGQ